MFLCDHSSEVNTSHWAMLKTFEIYRFMIKKNCELSLTIKEPVCHRQTFLKVLLCLQLNRKGGVSNQGNYSQSTCRPILLENIRITRVACG